LDRVDQELHLCLKFQNVSLFRITLVSIQPADSLCVCWLPWYQPVYAQCTMTESYISLN